MERSKGEWVFVKRDGVTRLLNNKTAFMAACRRAKLTGVSPHVLRHTFAATCNGGHGSEDGSGAGRLAKHSDGRAVCSRER